MSTDVDFTQRSYTQDLLTDFNPRNPYAGDERLPVKFFIKALPDAAASLAAGHEMFRDTEVIEIIINKDEILVQPVDETHKMRWPRQYAAWKATGHNEPGMTGTPLDRLLGISPAQVEALKYHKIFSIERLADAPDQMLVSLPGMQALKQKAQSYLQIAKDQAPLTAAAEALERLKAMEAGLAKLNEVVAQNAELAQRNAALENKIADLYAAAEPRQKRTYRRKPRQAEAET